MSTLGTPTLNPVDDGAGLVIGGTAPDPALGPDPAGGGTGDTTTMTAPTLPGPAAAGGTDTATASTWRSGVTVDALFCVNEVRNAWMRVVGLGWRKIYNGRDGAFTALVTLATQARQTGRTISFREEADGMAYEIYLW